MTTAEQICAICLREISCPSPKTDDVMRNVDMNFSEAEIPSVETQCKEWDTTTNLGANEIVHGACNQGLAFILEVSPDQNTADLRLKGYRAGKTFGGYMNWSFGLESPSVNSYRELQSTFDGMLALERVRGSGKILSGDHFSTDGVQWRVVDVTPDASMILDPFVSLAESVLSLAVVSWHAAHKGSGSRPMFLSWDMYKTKELKEEIEHFRKKRDKEIAHNDKDNSTWNTETTNQPYQPYPNWMNGGGSRNWQVTA